MTCSSNKIQTVLDFVRDIKPFHSKIYEVQLTYQINEQLVVDCLDQHEISGDITIDYYNPTQLYNDQCGWSVEWDVIWKHGDWIDQPIIAINPVDNYISFVGDVAYSFSMDAYAKGVSSVPVIRFDPNTGVFDLSRPVPWVSGYPVSVDCSMLFPAPLQSGGIYYAIVDSTTRIRLATTRTNAILGYDIQYSNYAAGAVSIKAMQHAVEINSSGHTIYVTATEYDITTNRTHVFITPESFNGLDYGMVRVLTQSNWDVDPTTNPEYRAAYTVVETSITESLFFDFSDVRFHDLVGVGPVYTQKLEPWGGDDGQRIVMPQAIDRVNRRFAIVGDWRFFASSELSSSSTGSFLVRSHNQPDLVLDVIDHTYNEGQDQSIGYTNFMTNVDLPDEFTLSTQLVLYTNTIGEYPVPIINGYWDHFWDQMPISNENTADTMISETLQIFVDQGAISVGSLTWDGTKWDYDNIDEHFR